MRHGCLLRGIGPGPEHGRSAACRPGWGHWHHHRVVQLLHLRHRRGCRLRASVLSAGVRPRGNACGLRHLRHRIHSPAAGRRGHGPLRRPARPQVDAGLVADADGAVDARASACCRTTRNSVCGRRCCSSPSDSCKGSHLAANGAGPCSCRWSTRHTGRRGFFGSFVALGLPARNHPVESRLPHHVQCGIA